jgi:hypothetical protein
VKADTTEQEALPDQGALALERKMTRWLRRLVAPGQVVEMRAVGVRLSGGRKPNVQAGYFDYDHLDEMAEWAAAATTRAQAVYMTLNPIDKAFLDKAGTAYQLAPAGSGTLATDHHVLCRRFLPIDLDPVRQGEKDQKIPSTVAEKEEARKLAARVREELRGEGWPDPHVLDSGNGYWLLYRVGLPNDTASRDLVERCLKVLAARYDSDKVKVDQKVHNASRICKVPGTWTRKAEHTEERPHRQSRLLKGGAGEVVPAGLLVRLAAEAQSPPPRPTGGAAPAAGQAAAPRHFRHRLKVADWLRERGGPVLKVKQVSGGRTAYVITCPFNPAHTGDDCCVMQSGDGQMPTCPAVPRRPAVHPRRAPPVLRRQRRGAVRPPRRACGFRRQSPSPG